MNATVIESLLKPKGSMGFLHATETMRKVEKLDVPEAKPLTLKDFGLVPLSPSEIILPSMQRAKIVISDFGVPVKSPEQIRQEQDTLRYAAAQGKTFSATTTEEIYVDDTRYEGGGDQGLGNTYGQFYGLPGNILAWSMGGRYSEGLEHPVIGELNQAHQSFDIANRKYRPDIEDLKSRGYGEEGIRRLTMLGLMTDVIHHSNGIPRVNVNTEKCQVLVRLNGDAHLQTRTRDQIIGFVYSLSGLKALTADNRTVDLVTIERFPDTNEDAIVTASKMTKLLIDRDRIDRPKVIAGATIASTVF